MSLLRRASPILMTSIIGMASGVYIFRPLILEHIEWSRQNTRAKKSDPHHSDTKSGALEPSKNDTNKSKTET
ncbi:hypothetical protein D9758_000530 [Tetrapyrgos nigripes]|uniref:Uncharacterized protein n=1 Tax=Tetrapyrgos nigripes TaxID=182062 RepID=A0A8H5LZ18_9AGAR|nr:hypothetical protein D9758_000530 [Tetrapyrgos nigripes]